MTVALVALFLLVSLAGNLALWLDARNARARQREAARACEMWRRCAGDAVTALQDVQEQRNSCERDYAQLAHRFENVRKLYIQRTQEALLAGLREAGLWRN